MLIDASAKRTLHFETHAVSLGVVYLCNGTKGVNDISTSIVTRHRGALRQQGGLWIRRQAAIFRIVNAWSTCAATTSLYGFDHQEITSIDGHGIVVMYYN
jgi:hypothetical protein